MIIRNPTPSLRSFAATMFFAAFALNWLWEVAQMPAYAETAERSWRESVLTCTIATVGDALITLAIYGVGALASARLRWGLEGGWNVYATVALLGGACAVAIEWRALAFGHWSYSDRMPVVLLLDIGLWPLLQLTLLVPAALWIAARWTPRGSR
jgi:hypothetical protein